MENVLFYLVPTNELARRAVQSASNRSLREGLLLRIPLPELTSLRQSPEKTDFLSFGTQPDNRVVLPGDVAAPYHCHLWLRRQQRSWMLTDTSSGGTLVVDAITPNIGETINRETRAVVHLTSLQVAGCAFGFRYPKSDKGNTNVWTQHLDTSPILSTTDDPHTELRMPEHLIGPPLGSGGQGRVLKVLRKRTGFIYALKEITIPMEAHVILKQQEREIQYMKTLRHDGILNLLAFHVERGPQNFIVRILMPLCKTSLEKIIPDERIFYDFMRQGCEAMDFLHSHQIIHRDIKPQNILRLQDQPYRYVLTDFGYANIINEAKTICGTPGYMAPEILGGEPYGAKSDTFSLGVVGLEILGKLEGIQDEVRELPKGCFLYQCGRQVEKRIFQVSVALAKGELADKEGRYKLLAAMTERDPKARPTARQALCFLTPQSSAYSTRGSEARFEPLAECKSEDPKANSNSSRPTTKQPPAGKRHLALDLPPPGPGENILIHEDVMTRPLQVTKASCSPGLRTPIPKSRPRTKGLRQQLKTNNNLARLTTSPYPKNKPEAATKDDLLKPAKDTAFSRLNAPEPTPNKGNKGRCGNPTTDLAKLSKFDRTAKKTSIRHEVLVPACLKAQHSRFDRSRVAKRKPREQRKIPGAWCVCKDVSCGGTCSMYKPDLGPGWISHWYFNGKENLVKQILALFRSQ